MFVDDNILSHIRVLELIEFRTEPRVKGFRIKKTISYRSQMLTLYSVFKRFTAIGGMAFCSASPNIKKFMKSELKCLTMNIVLRQALFMGKNKERSLMDWTPLYGFPWWII